MKHSSNPPSRLEELIELKSAIEDLLVKADDLELGRAAIGLGDAMDHIELEIQAAKGLT